MKTVEECREILRKARFILDIWGWEGEWSIALYPIPNKTYKTKEETANAAVDFLEGVKK